MNSNNLELYILAVSLIVWCVIHSAMISITATDFLKKLLGEYYRYYRLFYNTAALLTLLPIGWYKYSIQSPPLFSWEGHLKIAPVIVVMISLLFFFFGAKRYDMLQFLGVRQIKKGIAQSGLTESGKLDTGGILGLTRHPWYAGAIFLIWSGNPDISSVITNVILTGYLIIGTVLEERKLVIEYGEQYREYQKNVSMFIPFKWLKAYIKR